MKIKIDIASTKDSSVICHMIKCLYLELGEEKESIAFLSIDFLESMIANGATFILKATSIANDEIIGILCLSKAQAIYAGGDYGIISDMYVKPQYRSDGVGKKLIIESKKIATGKDWKRIEVTAPTDGNSATVRFYENNGFSFTGPKMKWKKEY